MRVFLLLVTLFLPKVTSGEACVDYYGKGYFVDKEFALGLPSNTFTHRPVDKDGQPTLTACELEELHTHCVQQINRYRSGELKFSDGTDDDNVLGGLSPLQQVTGAQRCSSESAMGDLIAQGGNRGCGGAHANAFTCMQGAGAQNSCCGFGDATTKEGILNRIDGCLQSMWDEGITPGQKGHWETMRSTRYSHVACGFAYTSNGLLFANQDFSDRMPRGPAGSTSDTAQPCTCEGKMVGDPDACGGLCSGRRSNDSTHRIVAAVLLPIGLLSSSFVMWSYGNFWASRLRMCFQSWGSSRLAIYGITFACCQWTLVVISMALPNWTIGVAIENFRDTSGDEGWVADAVFTEDACSGLWRMCAENYCATTSRVGEGRDALVVTQFFAILSSFANILTAVALYVVYKGKQTDHLLLAKKVALVSACVPAVLSFVVLCLWVAFTYDVLSTFGDVNMGPGFALWCGGWVLSLILVLACFLLWERTTQANDKGMAKGNDRELATPSPSSSAWMPSPPT